MATLNFNKEGNDYVARFVSTGNTVVQLEREERGVVSVCAGIGSMDVVPVAQFQNGYTPNVIFAVNVPSGVNVVVKSQTEVKKAETLTA